MLKGISNIVEIRKEHPSLGRMMTIFLIISWGCHIGACLLVSSEEGVRPTSELYFKKLYIAFMSISSASAPATETLYGKAIGVGLVLCGLVFFASFIGNISSYFNDLDEETI